MNIKILNHCIGTGHQPLSWCARIQIALDAAKGLEYIHDYTKARYVHRDIKTSNILLDEKLRAKVLVLLSSALSKNAPKEIWDELSKFLIIQTVTKSAIHVII